MIMEQYVLELCKVYINDDPELTLTHFKTVSNFVKLFCTYSSSRCQVSVYRTIGPLVLYEPRREKTGFLHMRKQRRRSASR